jgi:hypothetical protein
VQALVWHLNVFICWMDMIGPIFSGSLVNIVKQFRVWMLLYWSAFNNMLKTKCMGSVCYIVIPSLSVQPFLSDIWWVFFLLWRGNILHQPCTRSFPSLPIVRITSFGNTPIRLSEFQRGNHHLWSSIVGYWAKIIFLYFRVFTGIWHPEHFCKITRFRFKLNPEMSEKGITRDFAI